MQTKKKEYCLAETEDGIEKSGEVLFSGAEEAWFWYCRYENHTPYKANNSNAVIERPCAVDDIYVSVAKLYLARKIGERHVRTLVKYGRAQVPPDPRVAGQEDEAMWWDDALDKLETILARKGIVRCAALV
ncbi:MAG: hypothetical protein LBI17_00680 [Rickettsiales bacterium]|jgi:hypothetical protein|nr:hypothetical protein [Rickettsiales bacterium]